MEEFNKDELRKKMEKFNEEELREDLESLAYKSYRYGLFIGIDAAFQMLEKLLDCENISDPLSKESLRSYINEFRKANEVERQKLLDYEKDKDEDKDKDKEEDN